MSSIVEDFAFIAQRAKEIRAARYQELCVSPPASSEAGQQSLPQRPASDGKISNGFKYAPGFEHLAALES